MLEGRCPKCGTKRYGWALLNPRYQTCSKCGAGLEILEDGHKIAIGFSPFTAERIDTKKQARSHKTNVKSNKKSTK